MSNFTIRSSGPRYLKAIRVTMDGEASCDYVLNTAGTCAESGNRLAALRIASNGIDENPFDLALTGLALATTADGDSDGLTDLVEYHYAVLNFDW